MNLRDHYLDQPHEVTLETQAVCNAACTFCPYPTMERKGAKMSDELIARIITEMGDFEKPFYFCPFKLSDPLLDKRLVPIVDRVNKEIPHAKVRIFTNGSALTADKVEQLGKLKLDVLWISLNSHDPDEYKKLMGLDFERTTKKLDYLHSVEFPHPVMLSCVGYPNEAFRFYCFQRWPKFHSMAIKKDAWLDYTDPQVTEVPDTSCSRWFELSIMADGRVAHCCMDDGEDPRWTIGDVTKNTLLEVYNSPFWRERREKMLSRKQLDDRSPCSRCTY